MTDTRRAAEDRAWRRAAARRFLLPAAALVLGVVLAVLGGDLLVPGIGLITVMLVAMMCLVFLEVGYSEDRARARERPPAPAEPPREREKPPRRPSGMRPRRP